MIDLTPILQFDRVVVWACTIGSLTDLVQTCETEGILWCATNHASEHDISTYALREQPGLMIFPKEHSFIFVDKAFRDTDHQFYVETLYDNELNKTVVKAADILDMLEF